MRSLEDSKAASRAAQAGLAALYADPTTAGQLTLALEPEASKYRPGFHAWLAENDAIWERFRTEANRVWDSGRRHWSARTIIEYIRHETALSEPGGAFKINNDVAPDLARLFQDRHPERAELFATRVQQGGARAA